MGARQQDSPSQVLLERLRGIIAERTARTQVRGAVELRFEAPAQLSGGSKKTCREGVRGDARRSAETRESLAPQEVFEGRLQDMERKKAEEINGGVCEDRRPDAATGDGQHPEADARRERLHEPKLALIDVAAREQGRRHCDGGSESEEGPA